MALVRLPAKWQTGNFGTHDEGASQNVLTEQSQLETILLICQIKTKRKVSNQKTHEEYKQVRAKLGTKKQEFERRKERETQSLYKKKIKVFKILSKKL
ncbi:hypothetical protein Celaphus_00018319 [Cervus elaphus hippelaphus]|uniref:Uncharacterized protein n=1 Tax=Cervus elaphus hippelaphus TaxID=46360 RepID=A0A212C5B5_CEREH|nr:hypothetical protein Celaphus_00018319 [Cervus elaphus hippelaphus]